MESGIRRHAESPDSRRGLVVGGTVVNRSPGRKSVDSGPLGEIPPDHWKVATGGAATAVACEAEVLTQRRLRCFGHLGR
ncbi:MAG: hypothetical protein RLZZ440_1769 [Planctomycetota bacterium]